MVWKSLRVKGSEMGMGIGAPQSCFGPKWQIWGGKNKQSFLFMLLIYCDFDYIWDYERPILWIVNVEWSWIQGKVLEVET